MGTPRIYWYPAGALSFQTIVLPYVSAVNVAQFRNVIDAEGLTMSRLDRGGGRIITIRARYNVAEHHEAIRGLLTLDSHLRSGGRIAFGLDSDKMYASRLLIPGFTGRNTINVDANNALTFGTVTLSVNDELLLQQTAPLRYERVALSSGPSTAALGQVLTLKRNLYYEHPKHTIVRTQYCYPALYLDAAGSNSPTSWISDTRHPGIIYDLDLSLVELPHEIESLVDSTLADGNRQIGEGGVPIEEAVQSGVFTGQRPVYRRVSTEQPIGNHLVRSRYPGQS